MNKTLALSIRLAVALLSFFGLVQVEEAKAQALTPIQTLRCYSLEAASPDSMTLAMASRFMVRLALEPAADSGSVMSTELRFLVREGRSTAFWRSFPGDSLLLALPTGFEGVAAWLGRSGDQLTGVGVLLSDVVGPEPDPTVTVKALEVPCTDAEKQLHNKP